MSSVETKTNLPEPKGKQKEVLCLPPVGHAVVLGTAGSGKTTMAIHRAAYLASPAVDHFGRTMLVTFNKSLVAYLGQYHDDALRHVHVRNYHWFARGYLSQQGQMRFNAICRPDDRRRLICRAVANVAARHDGHPLFKSPTNFFSDEIRWLAQRGIHEREEYRIADRIGRGTPIQASVRELVFDVVDEYRTLRAQAGKLYDWDDIAPAVEAAFAGDAGDRLYRHVVIDEGQYFSPSMIRSLVRAVPEDGSVTFFGDMAQQVYGRHRIPWNEAGLKVSKVWELTKNYRNSKQIAQLAIAISEMPYYSDMTEELVTAEVPVHDGPLPTLVRCSTAAAEVSLIVEQAVAAATTKSVAILLRRRRYGQEIIACLPKSATEIKGDMPVWRGERPGIYYGTYHSVGGMEFDLVIMPLLRADRWPDPAEVDETGPNEAASNDGRLLYVGVTRARRQLILTHTGAATSMLPNQPRLYARVER